MFLRTCKLVKQFSNNISSSIVISFGGKQRLKLKVDIDSSRDTKVIDVKAAKNREIWEKQNSESKLLQGKFSFDDVFFTSEYEALNFGIADAISMHKEYCLEISMLDAPYAVLKATFLLNLRTKKTTKFLQKVGGIVILPHNLDFIEKRKILVFCKNPEDIEIAMQNGAFDAGDESLVKKLEQGLIHYEEFDQAVCHTDALPLVNKIRPILKDKLPTRQTPRVGTDIKTLVTSYVNGYEYESKKVEGINEEGHLTVPLGLISWPSERLEENLLMFIESIMNSSSSQILGNILMNCTLSCPPSDEIFRLNISDHIEHIKKKTVKSHIKANEEDIE